MLTIAEIGSLSEGAVMKCSVDNAARLRVGRRTSALVNGTICVVVIVGALALAPVAAARTDSAASASGGAGISGASNGLVSVARTIWYNTPKHVADTIYYHWNTSDGVGFGSVYCRGEIHHLWIYRNGRYWFHRLSCNAWDYWDRHVGLQVWVTGQYSIHVLQTWCHDSYSSYSCPYYSRMRHA